MTMINEKEAENNKISSLDKKEKRKKGTRKTCVQIKKRSEKVWRMIFETINFAKKNLREK